MRIASEAAIRLGSETEERVPGLAWRDIRGIGNWPRHQYERIELDTIWKTVADDLPRLKAGVLRALYSAVAGKTSRRVRRRIPVRGDGDNDVSRAFPNGSRIVGLPGIEGTVREFSAVFAAPSD